MRLIDADGLFDYLFQRQNKAIKEDGERWGLFFDIGLFAISKAPTVEAIPIEWIKKWSLDHYPWASPTLTTNVLKHTQVWQMLEDWEKENDKG